MPTTAGRFGGRSDLRWTRFGGFAHRVIARVSRLAFGSGTTCSSGRAVLGRPRPLRRHRERDGTVAEQACLRCSSDVEGLFGGPEHHSSGGPGRRIWDRERPAVSSASAGDGPGGLPLGQQHAVTPVAGLRSGRASAGYGRRRPGTAHFGSRGKGDAVVSTSRTASGSGRSLCETADGQRFGAGRLAATRGRAACCSVGHAHDSGTRLRVRPRFESEPPGL